MGSDETAGFRVSAIDAESVIDEGVELNKRSRCEDLDGEDILHASPDGTSSTMRRAGTRRLLNVGEGLRGCDPALVMQRSYDNSRKRRWPRRNQISCLREFFVMIMVC